MTISALAYYGGSGSHQYTAEFELFTIPNYTQTRVWTVSNADIVAWNGFFLRLPDVTTLRGSGINRLVIFNECTENVAVQHSDGSAFFNMFAGNTAGLTLIDRTPNDAASWIRIMAPTMAAKSDNTSRTFNVGSDFGSANAAENYDHETDAWAQQDPVPIASGTPYESASSEVFDGNDTDGYFSEDDFMYRFRFNLYTQVATSNSISRFSGMSNEGSTIYKIAQDSLSADRYDPVLDSWSVMPAPTGVPFNNSVSTDWGLRTFLTTAFARIYITAGTPDGSNRMLEWDIANQTYANRSLPVASFGAYAPSMTGLGGVVHMLAGSFNSTVIPDYSSTYHGKYDLTTDAWGTEPQVPIRARGMGCAGVSSTIDRFTFGMGEVAGYPATQTEHYRYKTLQQTYDGRSFFAWGARGRRENAWARVTI
jgi:hypothetical protein